MSSASSIQQDGKGGSTSTLKKEGEEFLEFVVHLSMDTAKNVLVLIALWPIFFAATWLKAHGMAENDVRQVEQLHLWLTYSVVAWIGIVFFAKLVVRTFK